MLTTTTQIDTCNVGLIGAGWIASLEHGPALQRYISRNSRISLTAVCDIDANHAKAFTERFGFERYYVDVEEMLTKEDIQAVYVMVPADYSAAIAAIPLRHGIATLVEKPPCTTVKDLSDLINISEKTGAPNFVAFNRRCMPFIQRIRQRISDIVAQDKVIPDLISCRFARFGRYDKDFSATAIHAIDVISFLCRSRYHSLQIEYYKQGSQYRHDNFLLHGRMQSGTACNIEVTPDTGVNHECIDVHFPGRILKLKLPGLSKGDGSGSLQEYLNGKLLESPCEEIPFEESTGFYRETELFLSGVLAGVKIFPDYDFRSCMQSVEIMNYLHQKRLSYP